MSDLLSIEAEDFCGFRAFKLPLYQQGLVWIGGDNQDSAAAGSNGSGKSNVYKALGWGLFGETIDNEKGDKVIRHGTTCARVKIRIRGRWRIMRERRKGAPRLYLFKGKDEYKADKGDVQAKINELVGMDWRSFRNIVLYGQADRNRFVDPKTTDQDRKKVLHHILRTDETAVCHEVIKRRNLAVKHKMEELDAKIADARARMEATDLDGLEEESRDWEQTRKERLQAARLRASNLVKRAKEVSEEAPDVSGLELRLSKLQRRLERCEEAEKQAKKLSSEVDKLSTQLSESDADGYATSRALSDVEARLASLEGEDRCPVCTSPLGKGDAAAHVSEMRGEVMRLKAESEAASERSAGLRRRLGELKASLSAAESLADEKSGIKEGQAELKAEKTHAATVEARRRDVSAAAKEQLEAAKAIQEEPNPFKKRIEEARKVVAKYKRTIDKSRARLDRRARERAHYEFWVRGFSPSGLPSKMLDSAMPYLTTRANHYLDTLADGDIQMSFSTQRELKSAKGEFRDEIDISWEVEGVAGYPPSNGQFKKMEIATELALMDLAATRERATLGLLCLDECLDGLDSEGQGRVIQLLQSLRSARGTIYVISHDAGYAEVFEHALVVRKRDGVARLEAA